LYATNNRRLTCIFDRSLSIWNQLGVLVSLFIAFIRIVHPIVQKLARTLYRNGATLLPPETAWTV
jgi:hypothetical protein